MKGSGEARQDAGAEVKKSASAKSAGSASSVPGGQGVGAVLGAAKIPGLRVNLDISKEEMEKLAAYYTKILLISLGIFHTQDYLLDFYVAFSLYGDGHVQWAMVALVLCVMPLLGLFINHYFRARRRHSPILALLGLTYYIELAKCWRLGYITRSFQAESDFYVLAESLPSFILQAYIVLRNFFWIRDCENAYDIMCTSECMELPPHLRSKYGDDFSRNTCHMIADGFESKECWQWYSYCIHTCAATPHLVARKQVLDEIHEAGGYWNPSLYFSDQGRDLRARLYEHSGNLKEILQEESEMWFWNGCDESGSVYRAVWHLSMPADRPDYLGRWLYVPPGEPRLGRFVHFQIKTMDFELFTASFVITMISLATSLLVVSGSLSMKAVKEDRRSKSKTPKDQAIDQAGFFLHFLLDTVGTAGAISWLYSARSRLARVAPMAALVLALEYEFWFGKGRPRRFRWHQKLMAGVVYVIISPLSRIPGWPSPGAILIRRVLMWRLVGNSLFIYVGFTSLSSNDPKGSAAWLGSVFHCWMAVLTASLATLSPGPKLIYTYEWDRITEKRMLHVSRDLVTKRIRKTFLNWKLACPRYAHELERERAVVLMQQGPTANPAG